MYVTLLDTSKCELMLQSKIVPNCFSFTIAFSCGRAKMIKKTQHVDDDFWKAEIAYLHLP